MVGVGLLGGAFFATSGVSFQFSVLFAWGGGGREGVVFLGGPPKPAGGGPNPGSTG